MRRSGSVSAALVIATVIAAAGSIAPVGVSPVAAGQPAPVPKVVIIVGPAGSATDDYRADGRAAAAAARRYTTDVAELYSPDATWSAVKTALQGASLVLYMGHGNGWPSRYSNVLEPSSQDGFGLNPKAGDGDVAHQYYGEGPIARAVHLAPNAVVLLNHLCYASGLSEPGLPEGTLDVGMQRVDDFAAGFIKAGAAAVIAEAYASPARDVAQILGTSRSIQSIWLDAPNANDNAFSFQSQRSPGFVAEMDPAHANSGFERSIVLRAGLASSDVRAGAQGTPGDGSIPPIEPGPPSLVATGINFSTPTFGDAPLAGSTTALQLPYRITNRSGLPSAIQASLRWDPVDVPVLPDPGVLVDPPPPDPAEAFALVTPEVTGDLVTPATMRIGKTALSLTTSLPPTPGRYRLTITLHDADGIAFDGATQALLPVVIVRVTGDLDGAIVVAPTATLSAGSEAPLPVRVVNLGTARWGHDQIPGRRRVDGVLPATWATLQGRWVPLDSDDPTAPSMRMETPLPVGILPGASVDAVLPLVVPATPGDYLLVLDVITPDGGSITAAGDVPTIVRVHVVAAPTPEPDGLPGQP